MLQNKLAIFRYKNYIVRIFSQMRKIVLKDPFNQRIVKQMLFEHIQNKIKMVNMVTRFLAWYFKGIITYYLFV